MSFRFQLFDPAGATSSEIAAHVNLARACAAADRPSEPAPTYDSVVVSLSTGMSGRGRPNVWTAHRGEHLVGKGIVSLPADENTDLSLIDVQVHPEHRRRGIGTGLLQRMMPTITTPGRVTVASWTTIEDTPAAHWARHLGFRVTKRVVVQALDLETVDRGLWELPAPAGYRLAHWRDSAPEHLVESFAAARNAINDTPIGDLTLQIPQWTVDRVRREEAVLRDRNVEQHVVVAVHEQSNRVAGLTALQFYSPDAPLGYQHDTAVLAGHRGLGLGAVVKAAMLRLISAERPATRRLVTSTDAEQAPARRMNQRVGFEPVRTAIVVETPATDLAARVRAAQPL
ncbi:Acetyltransferase (GNAT) family protein [Actinoplanes philippinensis]|uniref:Acetyltransferase (GNAT) family protein n=1 Tax=Actinoplanes philippinensis TaxID=35752 RepID=A0A1I2G3T8_9ACTN|nr:Acetyltransferase (GNAT) family protein [Actinoplanes philippinensis]